MAAYAASWRRRGPAVHIQAWQHLRPGAPPPSSSSRQHRSRRAGTGLNAHTTPRCSPSQTVPARRWCGHRPERSHLAPGPACPAARSRISQAGHGGSGIYSCAAAVIADAIFLPWSRFGQFSDLKLRRQVLVALSGCTKEGQKFMSSTMPRRRRSGRRRCARRRPVRIPRPSREKPMTV